MSILSSNGLVLLELCVRDRRENLGLEITWGGSCFAGFSLLVFLPFTPILVCFFLQAEQQKQAAVISAEGDSKAAEMIANSLATAGDGLIELRKLEAAEDIAYQLARSRNVTYLPAGQSVLLQLPHWI